MNISHCISILAFSVSLSASAIAQNDDCAGAIALVNGAPTAYDTTTATPSAQVWPCAMGGAADLWYSYTPAANARVTFSTCGTTYDTAIEVFGGTCAALAPIGCNDDACMFQSEFTVPSATAGQTLLIRVGGWNGSVGAGTITATELPPILPTGSIASWLNEVSAGTAASYTNSLLPGPIVDDIGATNGANGVTYEFIVYGDNGGISSGLMGSRTGGFGPGIKFEQCCDSLQYGITDFNIADFYFVAANNTEQTDVHLAFVVDPTAGTTELFENGASFGTINFAPVLSGMQGIGQILDTTGNFDIMANGVVHGVAVYESQLSLSEITAHRDAYFMGSPGTNYCAAAPNSAGTTAMMSAMGSTSAVANSLTLMAGGLPNNQFGIFLTSRTQAFVPGVGGTSNGNLCLGGNIGRLNLAGQILSSGSSGSIALAVNLMQLPEGASFQVVMPGETWNFQSWYRDGVGLGSNFSDGLEIQFN